MKLKPAATSSPVHDTLQSFPGPRKHDADRSEDVTDQFQADGFAFVGTRRGFPIPQNDADRRSEAAAMNPQDGFRGSTREEEQTPDNVRVNERQQSQVNMVGGNRGIPSVLGEAQLVTEETQVPTTVAVENKRAHQSTPGETQQTAADLPVLPVRVPRLHAGFESIQPVAIEERSPREDQCWIFMYMEGGGGATVRSIVTDHWRRNEVMFDNVQWRRGDGYASDVMTRSHWQLLHGGCVESLRRYADKKRCRWFTVFRHPVARLLSAFEHCRNAPQDPLCASASSATGDLATFAEHWGNFGLMQFAMSVVSSNAVKKWAGSNNLGRGVSVWRLLKGYLDQDGVGRHGVARDGVAPAGVAQGKAAQSRVTEGGFAQGEALERLLEPAKELLRTQYAAVGIASELNTTMLLFDKALAMPGLNWSSALKRKTAAEGVPGSARDSPAGKGAMAEREAMANPRIGAALRLDILLYDHAVRVFHEQVRHYGID